MNVRRIEHEVLVPRLREEVFAFFADAGNLAKLTPPSLGLEILTPLPVTMAVGLELDYRIRVRGLPIRWTSRILVWDPPQRFVDEQIRGPYRSFRHEHRFEPAQAGTRVIDRVEYSVLGGSLVDRWLVRPDLERMFTHREACMRALWGA